MNLGEDMNDRHRTVGGKAVEWDAGDRLCAAIRQQQMGEERAMVTAASATKTHLAMAAPGW